MKRFRAPLTLVFALLLLASFLVAPAAARGVQGSVNGPALDHPTPPPGGDDDGGIPIVVEGDPDELTGGNLSVTGPEKPGVKRPNLWQSFLNWIQQSAKKIQSSR